MSDIGQRRLRQARHGRKECRAIQEVATALSTTAVELDSEELAALVKQIDEAVEQADQILSRIVERITAYEIPQREAP